MNIPVLTQCTNTILMFHFSTHVSLFYFFSTVEFQFGTEVFLLSAGLSPYIILILDRNIKHNIYSPLCSTPRQPRLAAVNVLICFVMIFMLFYTMKSELHSTISRFTPKLWSISRSINLVRY